MNRPFERVAATPTDSMEESKIGHLLEAWAAAVRAHDLDGVAARHAEDVAYFDVPSPPVRGIRGYIDSWPPFFRYIGEGGQFELEDLRITAGAKVAFAHAILLVRGEGETSATNIRLTVGLRKISGEWIILHEHHSAPAQ